MSSRKNSDIERHYFESFQAHYDVPTGQIEYTDKPDVIVRGRKTLGIEIANLYLVNGSDPVSEQSQIRFRAKALKLGQSTYRHHGGRLIEVTVGFDPRTPVISYRALGESLAVLVESLSGRQTGEVPRQHFDHIPEINFLYYNDTEHADAKWRAMQCYSTPNLSVLRVAELVAQKESKKVSYQPCEHYWLLLIVDFMDPAQDQDLHWPARVVLEKSPFERILLYKPQFAQVVRVPQ